MKRYLVGALCAVTTLALLAGCAATTAAKGGSSSDPSPSGSDSGPISTLPDPGDRAMPAQITADWSEDTVSGGWETLPAQKDADAAGVVFTTDSRVLNFQVLALSTEVAEDGTASYILGDTLYAVGSLDQGASLTAEISFAGLLPDRGIAYQETDGTQRYFALLVSGENGSLLMEDIADAVQH